MLKILNLCLHNQFIRPPAHRPAHFFQQFPAVKAQLYALTAVIIPHWQRIVFRCQGQYVNRNILQNKLQILKDRAFFCNFKRGGLIIQAALHNKPLQRFAFNMLFYNIKKHTAVVGVVHKIRPRHTQASAFENGFKPADTGVMIEQPAHPFPPLLRAKQYFQVKFIKRASAKAPACWFSCMRMPRPAGPQPCYYTLPPASGPGPLARAGCSPPALSARPP